MPRFRIIPVVILLVGYLSVGVAADTPDNAFELDAILQQYDEYVDSVLDIGGAPGAAIAIVHQDAVIYLTARGVREAGKSDSLDINTTFRLASLSKGFASVMAGLLVEDGVMQYDDPVVKHLPNLELKSPKATQELTLRHLLNHTTGVVSHAYDNLLDANLTLEKIIPRLREAPMAGAVGSQYGYQNVLYGLAGEMMKAATGESYEYLVHKNLFQPLRMEDASFGYDLFTSQENRATPHVRGNRRWVPTKVRPTYYTVPTAAGVNASISDLAIWLRAMMGGMPDVVSPMVLAQVSTPSVKTPGERYRFNYKGRVKSAYYGLGWRVFDYAGTPIVFHSGYVRGFQSKMAFIPEYKIGVAALLHSTAKNRFVYNFLDMFLGLADQNETD
jgi:beta-lactamase class C